MPVSRPRALGAILGTTGIVFALAWQHVQATRIGYRVERLREEVELQRGKDAYLKLDLERWHSPERLEAEAARRLGMRRPEPGQVVVLAPEAPPALNGGAAGWVAKLGERAGSLLAVAR